MEINGIFQKYVKINIHNPYQNKHELLNLKKKKFLFCVTAS